MSMKISAAIITHNEELKIARAIESLRCCDEIVVIDSGSNDRTVELAHSIAITKGSTPCGPLRTIATKLPASPV